MEERLRGAAVVGTVADAVAGTVVDAVAGTVAGTVVDGVAGTVASAVAGAVAGTVGTIGRVGGSVSPGVTLGVRAESRPTPEPNKVLQAASPEL